MCGVVGACRHVMSACGMCIRHIRWVWHWQPALPPQEGHVPLLGQVPLLEPTKLVPPLSVPLVPVRTRAPEELSQSAVLVCRGVDPTSYSPINRRRVGVIRSFVLPPPGLNYVDEDTSIVSTANMAGGVVILQLVPLVDEPISSCAALLRRRLHSTSTCQVHWLQE